MVNVRGSYVLWRKGLHCPAHARQGRAVYAVILLVGSALTAGYFGSGDWIAGAVGVVIVGSFVFDLTLINRYLDREASS